ncbi:MAG TPA: hypothetical protein VFU69_19160, partial [Ktedonobacterales bacterium]|nr:hypothetical protein [Ktedonobacterales bacterium]
MYTSRQHGNKILRARLLYPSFLRSENSVFTPLKKNDMVSVSAGSKRFQNLDAWFDMMAARVVKLEQVFYCCRVHRTGGSR